MDHSELIAELPIIEKLTPAERIQLARQRRTLQLLKWRDREKTELQMAPLIEQRNRRVVFGLNIALLEATARNDVDEVRRLLQSGADPNLHNEDGLTALHQCAIDNNEDLLLLLISHGADVNARDTELWTPLHAAGCCGHIKIVRHLIENGAELLAVNADGNMPYDICEDEQTLDYIESEMAKKGIAQEDIDEERLATERQMLADVEWFHKNGQSLDFRDENGATLLHIACANGFYLVVHFLLEVGASVHARDNDGWQPVHAASCWSQPDCLELLINYGADINARTPAGETPFDLCEDDTVRAVIMTLQVEQRRRMLSFARDSRRMSRRKKPSSKFESPPQAIGSDAHLSASRGAIRRHSLRDRAGVTLARLEARKEAALLRSWSFEDSSAQAATSQDPNREDNVDGTDGPHENGTNSVVSSSSVVLVSHDDYDDGVDNVDDYHKENNSAPRSLNSNTQRPNGDINVPSNATQTLPPSSIDGNIRGGGVTAPGSLTSSSSAVGQHISTSQWLQKIQNEERHQQFQPHSQQVVGPEVPTRKKISGGSNREKKHVTKTSLYGGGSVDVPDAATSERAIDVQRSTNVVSNNVPPMNGGNGQTSIGVDEVQLSRHPLTLSDLKKLRAEERQTKPNSSSSTTTTTTSIASIQLQNSVKNNNSQPVNRPQFSNDTSKINGTSSPSSMLATTTTDGPTARYRAPSDTVIGSPTLRSRSKLGGLKCCSIS